MATINAIESRSVHLIQSGQVIVDLCSVVKELVENSLDAGATSIDIRFKNQGLEYVEVQDNGAGISKSDYETLALKHYTSKLKSYDDLSSLRTFGFRGEALSSLCALSRLYVITAQDGEAPKGTRLDFDISGKLKGTEIAACQKGTTVAVNGLFYNLPVRRRELEKNIKREYTKVLSVLHAYACISVGVRFSVSHQIIKGKKTIVFSTKSNASTKENIANVYGAKTLSALIPIELELQLQSRPGHSKILVESTSQSDEASRHVWITGHISRPVFGEGRQTPDRQMFFVNSRPCALPQISKAINEVYKSYNVTQSPFIFADFRMDTNAYDVNVSPDKRSILLHDQAALIESLKSSLNDSFEKQEQTVPQSQFSTPNLTSYRHHTVQNEISGASGESGDMMPHASKYNSMAPRTSSGSSGLPGIVNNDSNSLAFNKEFATEPPNSNNDILSEDEHEVNRVESLGGDEHDEDYALPIPVQNFNGSSASQQAKALKEYDRDSTILNQGDIPFITQTPLGKTSSIVQLAYDRARPKRRTTEIATITIGDKTSSAVLGSSSAKRRRLESESPEDPGYADAKSSQLANKLRRFAAFDAQLENFDENAMGNIENREDQDLIHISSDELLSEHSRKADERCSEDGVEENDESASVEPKSPLNSQDAVDSEDDVDEAEGKLREEAKVADMVRKAEEAALLPTQSNLRRAANALRAGPRKDSTVQLGKTVAISTATIQDRLVQLKKAMLDLKQDRHGTAFGDSKDAASSAEERLSLAISKSDFFIMRIIGQFNLGFILATRSKPPDDYSNPSVKSLSSLSDLFIIDQHASDEIHNFSRLSLSTILIPQRLARPLPLNLTAIEEETIQTHSDTVTKNGFILSFDESGISAVGQRCKLLALPTSKDIVFDPRDFEELVSLLTDAPDQIAISNEGVVIRPTKVRRMLAMRACRSSIMVGRELTKPQMERVVRNMGKIERPWNCPHGRPTMRHLAGLESWRGWTEGRGLADGQPGDDVDWEAYLKSSRYKEQQDDTEIQGVGS